MSKKLYSKATSWIIRILLAIIVLGGIGLMMLSSLEGTSDQHRKGLEQAFSDMLKADTKIGKLEQFTILPQLRVRAQKIHGTFTASKNEFMADSALISFGFLDIVTANRKIEDFELKNFRFSNAATIDLRIDFAGIEKKENSAFIANGDWNQKKFTLSIPMNKIERQPPVYQFPVQSAFSGKYGTIDFKGVIAPSSEKNADIVKDGILETGGKSFATLHAIKQDNGQIIIKIDCAAATVIPSITKANLTALAKNDFVELSADCPK